jgi:hypothetical protein
MKTILSFFLTAMLVTGNLCQAKEIALTDPKLLTIQEQTLLPFFKALKNGDVSEIKKHMSPALYARNRVLLEENRDYPAFLRGYYSDVSFRVVKAEMGITGEDVIFSVSIEFPDGRSSINELKLSKRNRDDLQGDAWVVEKF